jgi:hypothetical protein
LTSSKIVFLNAEGKQYVEGKQHVEGKQGRWMMGKKRDTNVILSSGSPSSHFRSVIEVRVLIS